MSVTDILNALLYGDLPRSLEIFCPELLLCATILALLFVRLFGAEKKLPSCWVALLGTLVAFTAVFAQFMYVKLDGMPLDAPAATVLPKLFDAFCISSGGVGSVGPYFTGFLQHDLFSLFFRLGLLLFLVLVIALTVLSGIPDNEDGQDFYTLLIGATVGMLLAVSSNHLLMLFLAVEMMSVPSYAMVGFLKGRRQSSEAALKYVVYGAGAAGVMLYGVSLLSGLLGTANMPELAERFAYLMQGQTFGPSSATAVTAVLGIMMVVVGLAFKLSLVPFHFWCPDAFEGASAEVAGFLSVASKAASFALSLRFVLAFQGSAPVLRELSLFLGIALAVIAAASMTLGNLAAYTQKNVKRLLAYSTIAHAGYMVMAVAAMLVFVDAPARAGWTAAQVHDETVRSVEGLMYYLAVYLFMNLTAFAVVAMLRNETFSEDVDSYDGLVHQGPATRVLCVCLAIAFFSLVGLPPFGGFFAKLLIFLAVFKAGYVHWSMWALLAIAGANTVFSLFYYLRVLKAMFINEGPADREPVRTPGLVGWYVLLITVPILLLGASPLQNDLSRTAEFVADALLR